MKRRIIHIEEEKCSGCGACAKACHEGAIEMVNGKAVLTREDYCDGLGDCLPECPSGAITFEEREAPAYDEAAVLAAKQKKKQTAGERAAPSGCFGDRAYSLQREAPSVSAGAAPASPSALGQWPCQIKLMPLKAPYYDGAELLIAADCTAYAYADFHRVFMQGKVTVIGCPKLDSIDYSQKLSAIFSKNDIRSLTVLRMEVPCCGGLEAAARRALEASGKSIPLRTVTLSTDGKIQE